VTRCMTPASPCRLAHPNCYLGSRFALSRCGHQALRRLSLYALGYLLRGHGGRFGRAWRALVRASHPACRWQTRWFAGFLHPPFYLRLARSCGAGVANIIGFCVCRLLRARGTTCQYRACTRKMRRLDPWRRSSLVAELFSYYVADFCAGHSVRLSGAGRQRTPAWRSAGGINTTRRRRRSWFDIRGVAAACCMAPYARLARLSRTARRPSASTGACATALQPARTFRGRAKRHTRTLKTRTAALRVAAPFPAERRDVRASGPRAPRARAPVVVPTCTTLFIPHLHTRLLHVLVYFPSCLTHLPSHLQHISPSPTASRRGNGAAKSMTLRANDID